MRMNGLAGRLAERYRKEQMKRAARQIKTIINAKSSSDLSMLSKGRGGKSRAPKIDATKSGAIQSRDQR